ncbi:MAG: response regulator transcription factor [Anaerolineaceae bacterium]|nr:response regulator transcription factor [Anaerolineaceae bacterium]
MTIRILIADDHKIVRSGICTELSSYTDFEIVGEAKDGDEALSLTFSMEPDVLLLDITMPGMKVMEVMRQINQKKLATKILILSAFCDTGTVLGALKAGAQGYLLKDEAPYIIAEAARAVAAGNAWFSPAVSKIIAERAKGTFSSPDGALSDREWQILKYLEDGTKNNNIADELEISTRTVEFHITNIFQKLGVNSRTKAAIWARENRK